MWREKSRAIPGPMACPACEVPPPRAVIETPCWRHNATVLTTSSRERGATTPSGTIW